MTSNLEIAAVAGGSAVLGSLIAGGLAYRAMRRQMDHDREMRLMEARREACAGLFTVAFQAVNYFNFQMTPVEAEDLQRGVLEAADRLSAAVGEVRILCSRNVTEAAVALVDAVDNAREFALGILSRTAEGFESRILRTKKLPVANAPGHDEVMKRLGDAATRFVKVVQDELGIAG